MDARQAEWQARACEIQHSRIVPITIEFLYNTFYGASGFRLARDESGGSFFTFEMSIRRGLPRDSSPSAARSGN